MKRKASDLAYNYDVDVNFYGTQSHLGINASAMFHPGGHTVTIDSSFTNSAVCITLNILYLFLHVEVKRRYYI